MFSSVFKSFTNSLYTDRLYYMGFAMVFVILFHMVCQQMYFPILYPLKYGYIGVDVFLFFSSLGCSFSINKSNIRSFYWRRVLRIAPLFVIYAFFDSLFWMYHRDASYDIWDWFCNLTSLSFYGIGGTPRDWYLCFLILIYFMFPILFYIEKRMQFTGAYLSVLLSAILIYVFKPYWMYDCAISRIPIILVGILLYTNKDWIIQKSKHFYRLFICFSLLGLFLFVFHKDKYLMTTLLTPLLLFLLFIISQYITPKIIETIKYIGKKSLEIYVANAFAMKTFILIDNAADTNIGGNLKYGIFISIVIYFVLNIIYSILFIYANKHITNRF